MGYFTYRGNQHSKREKEFYAFPVPTIVSEIPEQCGCSWGWAPSLSKVPGMPFVLKFPYLNCVKGHYNEYRAVSLQQ
jgi:hypothetical protein